MKLQAAGKGSGWIFAVVTLLATVVCHAGPITYNVNRTIGVGSVTGFIETDGSLGVLTTGNIMDWNLVLYDGVNSFDLTGPLSGNDSQVLVQGGDVSASTTQLLFDFGGTDNGLFLFQQGLFSGNHYYCDATQAGACLAGETVVPVSVFTRYQNASRSGVVVIGTVSGSQVPEPGTSGLMLVGLGLVMCWARVLKNGA
jgi:hypothetical protein